MLEFNEHYIFHAKELIKLITSTSQEAYIVGECLICELNNLFFH